MRVSTCIFYASYLGKFCLHTEREKDRYTSCLSHTPCSRARSDLGAIEARRSALNFRDSEIALTDAAHYSRKSTFDHCMFLLWCSRDSHAGFDLHLLRVKVDLHYTARTDTYRQRRVPSPTRNIIHASTLLRQHSGSSRLAVEMSGSDSNEELVLLALVFGRRGCRSKKRKKAR